jgi:hypothetical protein
MLPVLEVPHVTGAAHASGLGHPACDRGCLAENFQALLTQVLNEA